MDLWRFGRTQGSRWRGGAREKGREARAGRAGVATDAAAPVAARPGNWLEAEAEGRGESGREMVAAEHPAACDDGREMLQEAKHPSRARGRESEWRQQPQEKRCFARKRVERPQVPRCDPVGGRKSLRVWPLMRKQGWGRRVLSERGALTPTMVGRPARAVMMLPSAPSCAALSVWRHEP